MKTLTILIAMVGMMAMPASNSIHQFTMTSIDGDEVSLDQYQGKVVLIVNVASKCGLTPQYKDLQALYTEKESEGLVILGFPANNFAGQEPGTDDEIETFCTKNYGVSFPMFSKISVKGKDMHPLYQFLTEKDQNGVMDSNVKWNFQKYLIDKNGILVEMIAPSKSVLDAEVRTKIDALLAG
ncbi:MAG TPA: glutathione peroxidase [Flavobacteriales bacterium]|jgi:glutathione peroxidase|nr:glutathione peroxidase [Flavobacteriales bacterium]